LNQLALKGDLVIADGIQKYIIGCNWKLAADNVWTSTMPDLACLVVPGELEPRASAPA